MITFVTSEIFNGFLISKLHVDVRIVLYIWNEHSQDFVEAQLVHLLFFIFSRMISFHSFFSEKDFNVQTCIIALDFNSGRDVYPTIWEKIKDKEIGILGKNVFRTLLKHILCIDLLKRRRTVMPLLVCQLIDPSLSTPKMILIKKLKHGPSCKILPCITR